MPQKLMPVRDPVWNYIYVTPIERTIIDRPEFQRLRFVLQNSSAYQTYPSNHHTRFLHSLGVMHVAGWMFASAYHNAEPSVLRRFTDNMRKCLEDYEKDLQLEHATAVREWHSLIGNIARFDGSAAIANQRVRGAGSSETDELLDVTYVSNMLWQAVRIAALIHDIGHYPLSHVFEEAIEDYRSNFDDRFTAELNASRSRRFEELSGRERDVQLDKTRFEELPEHELQGLAILGELQVGNTEPLLYRIAYRLGKNIFLASVASKGTPASPLSCLKSLISGSIDADRLDYSVRDPRSSGLESGAIDVHRILDSMTLLDDRGTLRVIPTTRAISAIESFFEQRHTTYKYLIYHHNTARMAGLAVEIVKILIEGAVSGADPLITETLDRFGFWTRSARERHFLPWHFRYYDDAWLRTMLAEFHRRFEQDTDPGAELADRRSQLKLLIDTLLWRNSQNVVSMWKRDADSFQTIANIGDRLRSKKRTQAVDKIGKGTKSGGEPSRQSRVEQGILAVLNDRKILDAAAISALRTKLSTQGVVLLVRKLPPKIVEPSDNVEVLLVNGGVKKVKRLEDISPKLRLLEQESKAQLNLNLFFLKEDLKRDNEAVKFCRRETEDALFGYVEATST